MKARIDTLSPVAARFVARLIGSLASPPEATVNPQTTWITEGSDWVEYFSLAGPDRPVKVWLNGRAVVWRQDSGHEASPEESTAPRSTGGRERTRWCSPSTPAAAE